MGVFQPSVSAYEMGVSEKRRQAHPKEFEFGFFPRLLLDFSHFLISYRPFDQKTDICILLVLFIKKSIFSLTVEITIFPPALVTLKFRATIFTVKTKDTLRLTGVVDKYSVPSIIR